jgi:hypothetical protein
MPIGCAQINIDEVFGGLLVERSSFPLKYIGAFWLSGVLFL